MYGRKDNRFLEMPGSPESRFEEREEAKGAVRLQDHMCGPVI